MIEPGDSNVGRLLVSFDELHHHAEAREILERARKAVEEAVVRIPDCCVDHQILDEHVHLLRLP
jgi:hypothetical protein